MEINVKRANFDEFGRRIVYRLSPDEIDWKDYRQYIFSRYSIDHARSIYRYSKKALQLIDDPTFLTDFSWRKAKYHLEALSALRDYLKLKNIALVYDMALIKKHMPHVRFVPVFIYNDAAESIIQQFKNAKLGSKLRFIAALFIYTGLRGTELKFMLDRFLDLKKKELHKTIVIELGYERFKKKAWLTMMPIWTVKVIEEKQYTVGKKVVSHLNQKGFRPGLARKAHVEILSAKLNSAEVDLLQGRLSTVLVQHYIRFLGGIAKRYYAAFRKYDPIIRQEIEKTGD